MHSCIFRIGGTLYILLGIGLLAGCGPQSSRQPSNPGQPDWVSFTESLYSVHGLVRLEGLTNSSGIQVYVPGSNILAITDENGQFNIRNIESGIYEFSARQDRFKTTKVGVVTIRPGSRQKTWSLPALILKPEIDDRGEGGSIDSDEMGSLDGLLQVGGVGGAAVADWRQSTIWLADPQTDLETPYRTAARSDGSFLLWNLPPGTYRLYVEIDGFETQDQVVRVLPGPADELFTLNMVPMELSGNRYIRGVVYLYNTAGERTNDFDRIRVEVTTPQGSTFHATLDAEGGFNIRDLPPAQFIIQANGSGYHPSNPVSIDLLRLPGMDIQLTLESLIPAGGDGAVVAGIAIKDIETAVSMSGIRVALGGTSIMAVTDREGNYLLNNVPPGSYSLIAQADGFEPAEVGPFEVGSGDDLVVDTLYLKPILDNPRVLSVDPDDGAPDWMIRREMPITVRFSKKMNSGSLREAISIKPDVSFDVFSGNEREDTDFDLTKIIVYGSDPDRPAEFKTQYRLLISDAAEDFEGLKLEEPFEASFRTGEPSVIRTVPRDGELVTEFGASVPIVIYFNAAMQHKTLNHDAMRIKPRPDATPLIFSDDDPETGWTRFYIRHDWKHDMEYTITIQRRARTAGRKTLDNAPYRFTFRTPRGELFRAPQSRF
jgi:hypothetical protein